jgi:hypothetical protein
MNRLICRVRLRSGRDLLVARQRARQVARLLGFDALEQLRIAAETFALAGRIRPTRGLEVDFRLCAGQLWVVLHRSSARARPRCFPLPCNGDGMPWYDARWVISAVSRLAPMNVLDEIRQLNQDLLHALDGLPRRAISTSRPGAA